MRVITLIAILVVAIVVAFHPELVYRPTPRAVLFLLIACLPAILFASEASAKFDFKLPGFAASAGGAAAIVFIGLLVLNHVAQPAQYVAVYHFYDEGGQPIQGLDREGAVEVPPTEGGYRVVHYVDGHSVILIFPEQVQEAELLLRPILAGPAHRVPVNYTGDTERNVTIPAS